MARQRGTKWIGDTKINGVRVRKTFRTRWEAEQWEASPHSLDLTVTCEQLFRQHYMLHWRNKRNAKNNYRHVEELIRFHPGDVKEWDHRLVVKFMEDQRTKRDVQDSTLNRKLSCLSKLLAFAHKQGYLAEPPLIEFLDEGDGRSRFLSPAEAEMLLSALDDADMHLAAFLLDTGCRFSEATNLKWHNVAAFEASVTFTGTKNGTDRTIPLTARARRAMRYARAHYHNYPTAWPIKHWVFYNRFCKARDAVGLDDEVIPHTLRHTCASWQVQIGIDLRRVKEWMGHLSLNTTLRYAHLAPKDLDKAMLALDALAQGMAPVPPQE